MSRNSLPFSEPKFLNFTMSDQLPTPENLQTVRQQLTRFSCLEVPPPLTEPEQQAIQSALLWFSELAEYETLGICADTLAQGKAATEAYVSRLSQPINLELPDRVGAVYIKFNTLKGAWYLDDYPGPSRGVLITYHTSDPELEAIIGTYGPFPLDLFG
jgi:hypothetical protein